jgi:hypothetical protein
MQSVPQTRILAVPRTAFSPTRHRPCLGHQSQRRFGLRFSQPLARAPPRARVTSQAAARRRQGLLAKLPPPWPRCGRRQRLSPQSPLPQEQLVHRALVARPQPQKPAFAGSPSQAQRSTRRRCHALQRQQAVMRAMQLQLRLGNTAQAARPEALPLWLRRQERGREASRPRWHRALQRGCRRRACASLPSKTRPTRAPMQRRAACRAPVVPRSSRGSDRARRLGRPGRRQPAC